MVSTGKKNMVSNKCFIQSLITQLLGAKSLDHDQGQTLQVSEKLSRACTRLNFSLQTPFHIYCFKIKTFVLLKKAEVKI